MNSQTPGMVDGRSSSTRDSMRARARRKRRDQVWNMLTFAVLVLSGLVGAAFLWIYSNPSSSLNFFPPPPEATTRPAITGTASPVNNTATLEVTPLPEITVTRKPTATSIPPTATLAGADLSLTPLATPDMEADYTYAMQSDPEGIKASLFNPKHTCSWMGVGGQVYDLQGRPVANILVKLEGTLNGKRYDLTSLTGTAIQYGAAGYEFTITDEGLSASKNKLSVRLIDQQNLPISPRVFLETFESCNQNLIIVNFKQVK